MNRQTTDQAMDVAMQKHGAFYAFSDKQFEEHKQEGIKYVSLFSGMIAPKENAKQLMLDMSAIIDNHIAEDIAENGIKAIIHRELANHECHIAMDYTDALDALDGYGITEEQVKAEWSEFFQHCVDNNYF